MPSPASFSLRAVLRLLLTDLAGGGGWRLAGGVALSAAAAGLEGMGMILLLPLLGDARVIGSGGGRNLPAALNALLAALDLSGLLAVWVVVVALLALFAARREVALARLNHDFVRRLRLRLHRALLEMEWPAFQTLRGSDVVLALTGNTARVGLGVAGLVQLMGGLLLLAVHSVIAFALAPAAAALALALGGALALTQLPRLRRMARHGAAMGRSARTMQAVVSEHIAGMKLARSHNSEPAFAAAFEREIAAMGGGQVGAVADLATARAWQKIAAAGLMAAVVWGCVRLLDVTGAPLLVLVAVFARLVPTLGGLMQAAQRVAEMLPSYVEVEALHRQAREAAAPVLEAAVPVPVPQGGLSLRGVTYTWPGRDRPAVEGIDLEIARNHTIALVGPSGAGKSTLADLCLGLMIPDAGTIQVGGTPLAGSARPAWRQQVAVVPQDVHLFHDTVRANLCWASPQAGEDALWQALQTAAAADMVRGLPQGLETVVGDRGVRLSGGERQRLALARALLRRPEFLILDEATSHLDRANERLIQDALERLRGRLTVLVIAHRLATVRHADHIVVIDQGRVVEQGDWDRLMAGGGWLARAVAEAG